MTGRLVWNLEVFGQVRLVAQQDTEDEQGRVATANLGQADQLFRSDHHLVRREHAITRGANEACDRVITGLDCGHIGPRLVNVDSTRAAQTDRAQAIDKFVAQPTVRLCHVARDRRDRDTHRAAQHVPVQQQCAAAGAAFENLDARGAASLEIYERAKAVAHAEADHHRGRRRDPPPHQRRPARLDLVEKGLVAADAFPRLLGW